LENLPFYGNISMEIGNMGKFPWIYGTMPWGGGRQVKIAPTVSGPLEYKQVVLRKL
jgi:hypothetical protein